MKCEGRVLTDIERLKIRYLDCTNLICDWEKEGFSVEEMEEKLENMGSFEMDLKEMAEMINAGVDAIKGTPQEKEIENAIKSLSS